MKFLLVLFLLVLPYLSVADSADGAEKVNLHTFFEGSWKVTLLKRISIDTHESIGVQGEIFPLNIENRNGTLSGQFVDADDEFVSTKVIFKDEHSGSFLVSGAAQAVVEEESDEFEGEDHYVTLFDFDFTKEAHQPAGFHSSHGSWKGGSGWYATDASRVKATYHLIAPSPLTFLLTITTDNQMIVYFGKKEPPLVEQSFFSKYGSSIMMFAFIIGLQVVKFFFAPQAEAAASPAAAPAPAARPAGTKTD